METNDISQILSFIDKIYKEKEAAVIAKIETQPKLFEIPYRSDEIKELATALAKAQGEFVVAGLNKENPYFKSRYADLTSVIGAARPALTKNGLSVVQNIIAHLSGENVLHTLLLHSSGQWIESRMRILPPKNDIQTISSYTTYLKRLSFSSLLGITTGDEDDDAEQAIATQRETFAKGTALNTKYNPREDNTGEVVSVDQLTELEYELKEYPDIAEMVMDGLKIQSIADIPKNKYSAAIRRIREIKQLRNGTGK